MYPRALRYWDDTTQNEHGVYRWQSRSVLPVCGAGLRMIYGDSGKIDRVTPQGTASRLRPRLALAGGLSTIASPFPLLLFQEWRKRRKLESMHVYSVCAWRRRVGMGGSRCTESKYNVKTYVGVPKGGRGKSVIDAQLHTDLNIDTLEPRLEMYHIPFFSFKMY